MLLGVLAAVALAGAGFAGGYLDPLKLLLSGLIWLPVPVAAGLLAFFTWKILSRLQPALEGTIFGDPYRSTFLRAGFALLAVSGVLLWESIAGDTGNFQNRYGGILLVWVILLLLAGRFMNSAVYLIIWPLLSMLSGCGWLLVARNFSAEPHLSLSVFALLALPGIALLIPVLHLMYEALSVQRAWIIAPAVSLFTGLYLPMLPVNNTPVPLLGLAVALFFLTAGAILAGYGPGKPRRDNLFYYYDADQNVARWASTGNKPVARLSRFFEQGYRQHPLPEYFPGQRNLNRKVISAETAGPDFEAPVLELLADTHEGALRRIRLKLRSVRRAAVVTLYLETPPGTVVEEARLAGKVLKDTVNKKLPVRWGIRFWEMPDESIELEIAVRTEAPLNFRVAEQSFDLEKLLPPGFQISSPESIPVPYGGFIPYCVLVARSYRF
jgi:cytochrome c oxidase subunit IV